MIITKEHEKKITSQFGEDGIIQTILEVIGVGRKTFIEIGVGDGSECNCINLRRNHGWTGILIEKSFSNSDVIQAFVTAENVQEVIRNAGGVEHPDVLSLDIDGNDWYVLANLGPYLPRLLVCEFNAHFDKTQTLSIPYDPEFCWEGTRFYGASQKAMHRLCNELGLSLVYSNFVNMFCVSKEYARFFDYADCADKLYSEQWSHAEDQRMDLMIDPFSVPIPRK